MSERPTILVVDDEPHILRGLTSNLRASGYDVVAAATGAEALSAARVRVVSAIVLDLVLPDIAGAEVCRTIRTWDEVPIVILSALDEEREKVAALDAGADDYVTKPFGMDELLARLRAVMRRSTQPSEPVIQIGELSIDLEKQAVHRGSELIRLTPNEFKLLRVLALNEGKLLTHPMLLRKVWGPGYTNESHYLRVYMSQLRRKIEADPTRPEYLLTEHAAGYRLVRPADRPSIGP